MERKRRPEAKLPQLVSEQYRCVATADWPHISSLLNVGCALDDCCCRLRQYHECTRTLCERRTEMVYTHCGQKQVCWGRGGRKSFEDLIKLKEDGGEGFGEKWYGGLSCRRHGIVCSVVGVGILMQCGRFAQ